ncbi:hypothetical protein FB451DRAFT_314634 [Mycena latifolia]|nr:hypothetical protein FB451DRAFT_314634 [Mycena latifolia]
MGLGEPSRRDRRQDGWSSRGMNEGVIATGLIWALEVSCTMYALSIRADSDHNTPANPTRTTKLSRCIYGISPHSVPAGLVQPATYSMPAIPNADDVAARSSGGIDCILPVSCMGADGLFLMLTNYLRLGHNQRKPRPSTAGYASRLGLLHPSRRAHLHVSPFSRVVGRRTLRSSRCLPLSARADEERKCLRVGRNQREPPRQPATTAGYGGVPGLRLLHPGVLIGVGSRM